jgi:3-oxoacyl-[acyl-carrier-protein] synthase-3
MMLSRYVHITGWGAYAPPRVVTNEELTRIVPTSDEWIRERSGIAARHIADDRDFTSTMATRAARRALRVAGVDPGKLDLVIVATLTPDYLMPSTACIVQNSLGATSAGACDLNAACSGFLYGVAVATGLIRAGIHDTVLVVGAESLSRVTNWTDRSTCVLFGDGAGAVVLEASDRPGGVLATTVGSDGSGGELLSAHLGTRIPVYSKTVSADENYIKMNGPEVFRFATRIMTQATRQVVGAAGLSLDDIDLLVPHQANHRILQVAAKQLGFPQEKIFSNLASYGNTSSASVPLALVDAIQEGRLRAGDRMVMVGFGGGLTWAACVVEWTYSPEDRQWSTWHRSVQWTRYRLAGAKTWLNRADRRRASLEERLRRRDHDRAKVAPRPAAPPEEVPGQKE